MVLVASEHEVTQVESVVFVLSSQVPQVFSVSLLASSLHPPLAFANALLKIVDFPDMLLTVTLDKRTSGLLNLFNFAMSYVVNDISSLLTKVASHVEVR